MGKKQTPDTLDSVVFTFAHYVASVVDKQIVLSPPVMHQIKIEGITLPVVNAVDWVMGEWHVSDDGLLYEVCEEPLMLPILTFPPESELATVYDKEKAADLYKNPERYLFNHAPVRIPQLAYLTMHRDGDFDKAALGARLSDLIRGQGLVFLPSLKQYAKRIERPILTADFDCQKDKTVVRFSMTEFVVGLIPSYCFFSLDALLTESPLEIAQQAVKHHWICKGPAAIDGLAEVVTDFRCDRDALARVKPALLTYFQRSEHPEYEKDVLHYQVFSIEKGALEIAREWKDSRQDAVATLEAILTRLELLEAFRESELGVTVAGDSASFAEAAKRLMLDKL